MPCKGDKTQICGAGKRLSLYKTVGWSPPINPIVDGYDYFGCYSEATPNRALSSGSTTSSSMTVEKCAASCKGAAFFGLENGNECRKFHVSIAFKSDGADFLQTAARRSTMGALLSQKVTVRSCAQVI